MAAIREFRLRLRQGEPVNYYLHTRTTFLDLPRELRDRIYSEALVSPNPITVCSITVESYEDKSRFNDDWDKDDKGRRVHEDKYILASNNAALFEELAFRLLRASKTIASEAALTFYRGNTFHFGGTEVWNPFYGWLDLIGLKNRSYLQRLSLELVKPECLVSNNIGIRSLRSRTLDFRRQKVVSCSEPTEEDDLRFVDPAIEACFRILGMHGPQLQLKLFLAPPFLPGVNVYWPDPDSYEPELRPWLSLEVPRSIEKYRREFLSRADVLWFGRGRKDMFDKQADEIREKGWEILETENGPHSSLPHKYWEKYFMVRWGCLGPLRTPTNWLVDGTFEQYKLIDIRW
jgi:hypothetical protein